MTTRDFKVFLEPDEDYGGYVVVCPSIPGCYSQGKTVPEALANIREAIDLCLEDMGSTPSWQTRCAMTLYSYPITVEREGKRYYAYSEDLPGVYGLGKSIEEAKKSILEAMRLYIQRCRKKGKPVPAARTVYAETVTLAMD